MTTPGGDAEIEPVAHPLSAQIGGSILAVTSEEGVTELLLNDARSGRSVRVPFEDTTGPMVDIWWEDAQRYFVVVETNADGQLLHTLHECTLGGGCQYRIEDESGTLWLPRD